MPTSRLLPLTSDAISRIRDYAERLSEGQFGVEASAKSDYWKEHSAKAAISFTETAARISGESGFYIPPEAGALRRRLQDFVHRSYKRAVLELDRILRLSAPHSLSSLLTYDLAYDFIVQRHPSLDYDPNPYCFDPTALQPRFSSSSQLRNEWFLHDRYLADSQIFRLAFYHALFTHHLKTEKPRYLEIGAGSGNLASFFAHYNEARVVIVDLPEVILFSSCFLASTFPAASFVLPHEAETLGREVLEGKDFVFLVPKQSKDLPDGFFDIAVNTSSLQEMTHAQIVEYFALVQRSCRDGALWCNVNRVEKFPSKTARPIRAQDFPYAAGNEVLIDQVDRLSRYVQPDVSIVRVERVRNTATAQR